MGGSWWGYVSQPSTVTIYSFFFLNKLILFIYFWLRQVCIAACGLSLVVASRGLLFVAVRGFLVKVASLVSEHGL